MTRRLYLPRKPQAAPLNFDYIEQGKTLYRDSIKRLDLPFMPARILVA